MQATARYSDTGGGHDSRGLYPRSRGSASTHPVRYKRTLMLEDTTPCLASCSPKFVQGVN